ncbi:hypothetical protein V6N13_016652 [Hibiscus sabdariffa]
MEYVEPAVAVSNCLGPPICKYLRYHRKLNDYVRNLKRIGDELNGKMKDIELQLKAELLQVGKVRKVEVEIWMKNVKAVIGEAQDVETKVSNGRYLCRACNGKLVDEKTQEMQTLLDKAPNASGTLAIDGPNVGLPLPTSELVGEKAVRDEIWQCLMREEVSMIGVWGMGGVGKTTIMKHIHNDLLKEPLKFDKVIWVTISKEFSLKKLQDDIASALNLKENRKDLAEEGNMVRRAAVLLEMLNKTGKHVLILDDVWDEFSLEEVGIPEPGSSNGCKLVLTTRSVQVCRRMGCKDIQVRPLSEEEALILFVNKVGPNMFQNTSIKPTLKLVVNECACLPLTIAVVAGTLKGEDDPLIWKNALKELKRRIGMVEGVEAKVIERLKFSFNHLKDEKVRQCFLYCALYPEDFQIQKDVLIECWIDEGFIDEMDTRKEMQDKGHAILKRLQDNCLLENAISRDHGSPCVKMHDALRDMALSITSTNPRYLIQAGLQLKRLPRAEEWRADIDKVSLMENSISEIPEDTSPRNCQLLTTLLLQGNPIEMIADVFFVNMPRLSVVNLSGTCIQSLPNSISGLKNLTALLLQGCYELRHVPRLWKLQGLKKLDLGRTKIEVVPEGTDMLVNLRLKAEKVVPLGKLERFQGCFQDMHEFNKFVSSMTMQQSKNNLTNYLLQVGPTAFDLMSGWDKNIRINKIGSCEVELIMLPFDVQNLIVSNAQDSRSLTDDIPCLDNAIDLRVCTISNCQDMECVVYLPFSSSTHPFQSLERLNLYTLPKLRVVIRFGSATTSILPPFPTFSLLKVIYVVDCSSMKTLLPHWLLPNLQNLEQILVSWCTQLIQILGAPTSKDEENESDALIKFSLPNFKMLELYGLPQLVSICGKRGIMVCDSLHLIYVEKCDKLERIPPFVPLVGNGQPYAYAPPSLQIKSSPEGWWEWLEWDHHPNFKNVLQPHLIK